MMPLDYRSLQRGVGLLRCGEEQGTATILAPRVAITARHTILDHLDDPGVPIEIHLTDPDATVFASIHPVPIPIEEDIALLELSTTIGAASTIRLGATHLPVGQEWQAFGFPSARRAGAWIKGQVSTWLPQGTRVHDVELAVTDFQAFRSYRGYSGGPVWVGGRAVAFLQKQLDGGLASTSVMRLRRHLDAAGIPYQSPQVARSAPATLRETVEDARPNVQSYWALEDALHSTDAGYKVLSGPAGCGKTIIAAAFHPIDPRLHVAATYFAGGDADPTGLPPEVHRDPGAFASWLAHETALVTNSGVASRSGDGMREHIASVQGNLNALAAHYLTRGELGVLIIDDFCGLLGGQLDGTLEHRSA